MRYEKHFILIVIIAFVIFSIGNILSFHWAQLGDTIMFGAALLPPSYVLLNLHDDSH